MVEKYTTNWQKYFCCPNCDHKVKVERISDSPYFLDSDICPKCGTTGARFEADTWADFGKKGWPLRVARWVDYRTTTWKEFFSRVQLPEGYWEFKDEQPLKETVAAQWLYHRDNLIGLDFETVPPWSEASEKVKNHYKDEAVLFLENIGVK